jgi:hypothetical protein
MPVRSLSQAWVVSAPLGQGIDLIAESCRDLAPNKTIVRADNYQGMPRRDRALWAHLQEAPSFLASLGSIPLIGSSLQRLTQRFVHKLPARYPQREQSHWNRRLVEFYYYLQHQGLGRDLIEQLSRQALPLITSSPVVAFSAEVHAYPGPIYLVCHAADPARVWAPLEPTHTRIQWIVPTHMAEERLQAYGVPSTKIHHFGLPLSHLSVSKKGLASDVEARIQRLDPEHIFRAHKSRKTVSSRPLALGIVADQGWRTHDLAKLLEGCGKALRNGTLSLHVFVGNDTRRGQSIEAVARNQLVHRHLGSSLVIHVHNEASLAFQSFTKALPDLDVLWSSASPWVFYSSLGLPVIVQSPIGGQEEARHAWLRGVQAGLPPLEPETASEWLMDWKQSGGLARLAWNGYGAAPSIGLERLKDLIAGKHPHNEPLHATIPE